MATRSRRAATSLPQVYMAANASGLQVRLAGPAGGARLDGQDILGGDPEIAQGPIAQVPTAGTPAAAGALEVALPDVARLLAEAARRRAKLAMAFDAALARRSAAWRTYRRREQPPLCWLGKDEIAKAYEVFQESQQDAIKAAEDLAESPLKVDVTLPELAWEAWAKVCEAHHLLSRAHSVWHVSASAVGDEGRAGGERRPAALGPALDSLVAARGDGLRFTGSDATRLDIFPAFVAMQPGTGGDMVLAGIGDLQVEARPVEWIEDEALPPDGVLIRHEAEDGPAPGAARLAKGQARQRPVMRYGFVRYTAGSAPPLALMASDCAAVLRFALALNQFIAQIRRSPAQEPPGAQRPGPAIAPVAPVPLPPLPPVRPAWELYAAPVALLLLAASALSMAWRAIPVRVAPPVLGQQALLAPDPAPKAAPAKARVVEITPVPAASDPASGLRQSQAVVASSAPPAAARPSAPSSAHPPAPSPPAPGSSPTAPGAPSPAPLAQGGGGPALSALFEPPRSTAPAVPMASTTSFRPVAAAAASPAAPRPDQMIARHNVDVREQPDANAESIMLVAEGADVFVVERRNGWARVGDGAGEVWGWVQLASLRNVP